MGDFSENEQDFSMQEQDFSSVNDGFAAADAESLDEYEGPTAAEAAEVFEEARRRGFTLPDLSSLDLRRLDWSAIRRGDFSSLSQLELPKVELPKVELPRFELPSLDALPKVDVDAFKVDLGKVRTDATSLVTTAASKATDVATDVRRSVESGVKLAREAVGI